MHDVASGVGPARGGSESLGFLARSVVRGHELLRAAARATEHRQPGKFYFLVSCGQPTARCRVLACAPNGAPLLHRPAHARRARLNLIRSPANVPTAADRGPRRLLLLPGARR